MTTGTVGGMTPAQFADFIIAYVHAAVVEERAACLAVVERWENSGSRFIKASDAIRARTPLT
jgi:hypothetical protein